MSSLGFDFHVELLIGHVFAWNRVILLTHNCQWWCPNFFSISTYARGNTVPLKNALFLLLPLLACSWYSDLGRDQATASYLCILLHLCLAARRKHVLSSFAPSSASRLHLFSLVTAAALSLPPALYSYLAASAEAVSTTANIATALPLIVFAAAMLLVVDPFVDRKLAAQAASRYSHITTGWTCATLSAWFVGLVAFNVRFAWSDLGFLLAGRWVIGSILPLHYLSGADALSKLKDDDGGDARKKSVVERAEVTWKKLRAVIKTILENDESRRIYYFLCLNFAYMGVQMMWGIWTNSLGLISDCTSVSLLVWWRGCWTDPVYRQPSTCSSTMLRWHWACLHL